MHFIGTISLTGKVWKFFDFVIILTFTDTFVSAAVRRSCLKHLEQYSYMKATLKPFHEVRKLLCKCPMAHLYTVSGSVWEALNNKCHNTYYSSFLIYSHNIDLKRWFILRYSNFLSLYASLSRGPEISLSVHDYKYENN